MKKVILSQENFLKDKRFFEPREFYLVIENLFWLEEIFVLSEKILISRIGQEYRFSATRASFGHLKTSNKIFCKILSDITNILNVFESPFITQL